MNSGDVNASFGYLEALYNRPIMPSAQVGQRRIEVLLEQLGNPHHAFPSVHITGTCGKGSTATMTGSILHVAGYTTGVFRSPHLDSYRERIALGPEMIGPDDWLAVFNPVRAAAEAMEAGLVEGYDLGRVSLFEMVWAMAALHFARRPVDIAVVEVGIGGRLSPTNVLSPLVSVLTNVSLDHTSFLGPTEADIAREKAQIIKRGNSATSAATQPDVREIIRGRAAETDSNLWFVGEEVRFDVRTRNLSGETFDVHTPSRSYEGLFLGMLGHHQVINAATAVSTIDLLNERDVPVSVHAVRAGLEAARLPGRFEVVSTDPCIVLDGARNVASAQVLADTLHDLFNRRDIVLLIGVLGDKDAEGIIDILAPSAHSAVVTEPPWEGRQCAPDRLLRALKQHIDDVKYAASVEEALDLALGRLTDGGLLLVTGSLYLVGAVRQILQAR